MAVETIEIVRSGLLICILGGLAMVLAFGVLGVFAMWRSGQLAQFEEVHHGPKAKE